MCTRLATSLGALILAFSFFLGGSAQAQQVTDAEFFQWQRLPEMFMVAIRASENLEEVEGLYNLCKENNIGPGATGAVLDQFAYAINNGADRAAALAALQAEVGSGRKGEELARSLAGNSMFEGDGILFDNFFTMPAQ